MIWGIEKMIYMSVKLLRTTSFAKKMIAQFFVNDIKNKDFRLRDKLWAWSKGFSATRTHIYNIDESNYKLHVPDFYHYQLHPINGKFGRWIDDKLTMKYLLTNFNQHLPEYYFHIGDGVIHKLMDCPAHLTPNAQGIIGLLKEKHHLALKPIGGSLGEGFYRLDYDETGYHANMIKKDESEVEVLLNQLKEYIITEYVFSHKALREIYDKTPNTLRLQVTKKRGYQPKITGGFMRFGSIKSGVSETPSQGGIFAKVDLETGWVEDGQRIENSQRIVMKHHPDTNLSFTIQLPHWELIISTLLDISNYLPQLSYIGYDILITEHGFKIIEMNSLTAPVVLPFFFPLLEDDYSRSFFKELFMKNPRKYKRMLKTIKEIESIKS